MAPAKRTAQEANILEDTNPIAKQKLVAQAQLAGRGRRGNGTAHANANGNGSALSAASGSLSGLKDLAAASETLREQNKQPSGFVDWSQEDRAVLVRYRDAYSLPSPTAFRNPSAQHILSSGIGSRSPTMIQRDKSKRRCPKEELAAVVRKHFKDTSVQETECLVEVMYRIRTQDKAFRLKFHPKPSK